MKILIIGSGGREHAIGKKILDESIERHQLFFAQGNGGTKEIGVNIELNTIDGLLDFAMEEHIDLTIVGSEELLVQGIVDIFQSKGLKIFGPNKKSAQLEGSKVFAKKFMTKYGVRTAQSQSFGQFTFAFDYIKNCEYPVVIKADGLAGGKGVFICEDDYEAEVVLRDIFLKNKLGNAGNQVVIEEYLEGYEVSILSVFNGKEIVPMISAKDHKKIGEGDRGLNTGGMGSIAPHPDYTLEVESDFSANILQPTLRGLIEEDLIFSGVIFFGLMVTTKGAYLLEYNMRMGDPETQAVLSLMESRLLEAILCAISGNEIAMNWSNNSACCVVMASGGYPREFEKGFEISGLDRIDCKSYIAGAKKVDNTYITTGGRVLNVVATAQSLDGAVENCYKNIKKIRFEYAYHRKDIGQEYLASNKSN